MFVDLKKKTLAISKLWLCLGTGTGSDSEGLDQLEKMRAELMSKLEDDFKLSPEEEETDSEDG